MHAVLNAIDSEVSGLRIVDVAGFAPGTDPRAFEDDCVLPLRPDCVFCKIPATEIGDIRRFEAAGYGFAEFQLFLSYRLKKRPDISAYPYRYEPVTDERHLEYASGLAAGIFTHDRYSNDPGFPPDLSGRRYQAYLGKSFVAPDERVYVMVNTDTGVPVSFATRLVVNEKKTRLLIGGVDERFKGTGLGVIHDLVGLATYHDEGVRDIETAVSGINYPIMNLEISHLGFRVVEAKVVLRKMFSCASDRQG